MYARQYETVTLVNADSGDAGRDKVLTRIREALEKTGGREVRVEEWGRRKTAFRLRRSKATKALYLYSMYLGTNKTVAEVERLLKITEEAILWQTIVLDDRVLVDDFDFDAAGGGRTIMAVKTKEAAEREAAEAIARAEREAADAAQRAAREAEDAESRAAAAAAAAAAVVEAPAETETETETADTSNETEE
jgi:small subunit ribosomal protein S6